MRNNKNNEFSYKTKGEREYDEELSLNSPLFLFVCAFFGVCECVCVQIRELCKTNRECLSLDIEAKNVIWLEAFMLPVLPKRLYYRAFHRFVEAKQGYGCSV